MRDISNFVVDESGDRLDVFLSEVMDGGSRRKIKAWCKDGLVLVDGVVRKSSFLVVEGAEVEVRTPEENKISSIVPEDIPLDILYEDDHIAVINKVAGMVVHPGAGVSSGTLVHALAHHFDSLAVRGGHLRPGIVHRLDKGTSGIILTAKTDAAHAHLTQQWQDGEVTKVYQALVWGLPDPPEGEITSHIGRHPKYRQLMAADTPGGRFAHSRYKTIKTFEEAAMVNIHILTGRTHQVRVHLAHIGHPVVGDAMYGKNRHKNLAKSFTKMPDHPMLHAALLRFRHPETNEEMTFKQPPPRDFTACAEELSRWPY